MQTKLAALLGATALFLGACQHPLVKLDPITYQSKAEEVADWDAMADRHAAGLVAALERPDSPPCSLTIDGHVIEQPRANQPIFIEVSTSRFGKAFRPLIEKHLLEHGYQLASRREDSCWSVNLDTQTFLYDRRTNTKSLVEYATFWTTLTSLGLLALDDSDSFSSFSTDTGAGIIAATGPAVDLIRTINDRTNAEVLLVLTVERFDHVYYSGTETFYVHPTDLWRYFKNDLTATTLPVRSAAR